MLLLLGFFLELQLLLPQLPSPFVGLKAWQAATISGQHSLPQGSANQPPALTQAWGIKAQQTGSWGEL